MYKIAMGFSSLGRLKKKPGQIIAIDLGSRTTKAVCLEKRGDAIVMVDYAFQEAPFSDRKLSPELLSEHLKAVAGALKADTRHVVLLVGATDAVICHGEMPMVSPSEMRRMVRLNSKNYFQEELGEHYFECEAVKSSQPGAPALPGTPGKARVVIGAARRQFVDDIELAAKSVGLIVDEVIPNQLGPVNALVALPDSPRDKVIAVVDIGFDNSTICLMLHDELLLTRVFNFGANKMTSGLADALNITYPVAEGLKQIMPEKVQAKLQAQIAPLARELRASIDFFEHQQEKTVTEVFVSGGSARSALIVQMLQTELALPCHGWDPTQSLVADLPASRSAEIRQDAPQLTAAIGAGLGWFRAATVHLNLLAEKQEEFELKRRDPVKRAALVSVFLIALMMVWAGYIRMKIVQVESDLQSGLGRLKAMQEISSEAVAAATKSGTIYRTLSEMDYLFTNRFLWHAPLLSLSHSMVDKIQVIRIRGESLVGPAPITNYEASFQFTGAPTNQVLTTLSVLAKDYGDPPAAEKLMESITADSWFGANLRPTERVRMKDRFAPQVDPSDPSKTFILFTVDCYFDRIF